MTGGEPAQLGLTREAKVLYGKEKKPLLNICDKKLSCFGVLGTVSKKRKWKTENKE